MIKFAIYDAMGLVRPKYETAIRIHVSDEDIISHTIEQAVSAFRWEHNALEPTHAVGVFEGVGKTWRHELFPEYKANREPVPELLTSCLPGLKARLMALGITSVEMANYEADDIIASIAHTADKQGITTFIVSKDKDFNPLISENITIRDHGNNVFRTIEWLKNEYDISPDQFTEYLALVGDATDNIPGAPGVGPTKAPQLLARFGDIETMIERSVFIKGKLGEKIRKNKEQIRLSLQLVTLKKNISVGMSFSNFSVNK